MKWYIGYTKLGRFEMFKTDVPKLHVRAAHSGVYRKIFGPYASEKKAKMLLPSAIACAAVDMMPVRGRRR